MTLQSPMRPTRPKHLFTFGYEGLDIEAFVTRLVDMDVRSVVDVRELPLSRKKGFSKRALATRLAQEGIEYMHIPSLGCPKPIRDAYRENGDWKAYTKAFLAHLRRNQPTVRKLAKLARATHVCLICFEADHTLCHRSYVAQGATAVGAPPVMHLAAETAHPDLRRAA